MITIRLDEMGRRTVHNRHPYHVKVWDRVNTQPNGARVLAQNGSLLYVEYDEPVGGRVEREWIDRVDLD